MIGFFLPMEAVIQQSLELRYALRERMKEPGVAERRAETIERLRQYRSGERTPGPGIGPEGILAAIRRKIEKGR